MKAVFDQELLPQDCLLLVCSSHEPRCLGILGDCEDWVPKKTILFGYEEETPSGYEHRMTLLSMLEARSPVVELSLSCITETSADGHRPLRSVLRESGSRPVVVDISVMSKRTLLLLLRLLDDCGLWDRLWIVYSEPEEYEIKGRLPLSFGVSSVTLLPGFAPSANPSRPLHAVMLLGYEGDRALSTYEILQPKRTTLIVPDPPFRPEWKGRTERLNRNLVATIDDQSCVDRADAIDPSSTIRVLSRVLGDVRVYSDFRRAVCPLGPKPQAVGAYTYIRECTDPPSLIYSQVLRHNLHYYSRGIGNRWIIFCPE